MLTWPWATRRLRREYPLRTVDLEATHANNIILDVTDTTVAPRGPVVDDAQTNDDFAFCGAFDEPAV